MQPDDAFGDYEAELVRVEPLDVFPDDVELTVGMVFEADDPETGDVLMFRVTQIADGKVVVDANHPLAWSIGALCRHRGRCAPGQPGRNLAWSRPRRTRPSSLMLADSVTESR